MKPTILSSSPFSKLIVPLVLVLSLAAGVPARCEDSVIQLDRYLQSEKWEQAAELARKLDEDSNVPSDLTLRHARLARALQNAGDLKRAAEFFQRSVLSLDRPQAASLNDDKRALVRLAAATVLKQSNQFSAAIKALAPVLQNKPSASQLRSAVEIYIQIGNAALASGSHVIAQESYAIAAQHADDEAAPTAMLGEGWALAIQGGNPLQAAKKLAAFIDRFPKHEDAARAARACAECLRQAKRTDDAQVMLADLLERWPNSQAAFEVVKGHSKLAVDLVPPAVSKWILRRAEQGRVDQWDANLTTLGLTIAAQANHTQAWSNLAKRLAQIDKTGQATADALALLINIDKAGDAETLAAQFISGQELSHLTVSARESACRWAGRNEKWSLLSLAAESEAPETDSSQRSVGIERLFAEALTQTGKNKQALAWWNCVVDRRGVREFGTLLRCAEAEIAIGEEVATAQKRVEAARKSANNDAYQLTLVDLLDAELSIRRTKFNDARALLERVVRSAEAGPALRGRAQWLIGETHYLQQKFVDAIEAYRRVEGIDSSGTWVSASLLQAGKSFEQLGRTRDATVCYGHLLQRFADSIHARVAASRLAAINPEDATKKQPNTTDPSPNTTIRR